MGIDVYNDDRTHGNYLTMGIENCSYRRQGI